jgi:hypothetical protein
LQFYLDAYTHVRCMNQCVYALLTNTGGTDTTHMTHQFMAVASSVLGVLLHLTPDVGVCAVFDAFTQRHGVHDMSKAVS